MTHSSGIKIIPFADWEKEAQSLFGEDRNQWRFVCPVCSHIATVQDWLDLDAENAIAFSCVGRFMSERRGAFDKKSKGPCNYTGGGLLLLNPIHVEQDGHVIRVFDFDRQVTP